MNIFVLDINPSKCAKYHADKHVLKMIVESTQLLSNNSINPCYKPTHLNHPSTKWVGASIENWNWLKKLVIALNNEYKYRYNKRKDHKSYALCMTLSPNAPHASMTDFVSIMPEIYKLGNIVESYRNYYKEAKKHLHTWTKRPKPFFI